jgi:hypothetical protein
MRVKKTEISAPDKNRTPVRAAQTRLVAPACTGNVQPAATDVVETINGFVITVTTVAVDIIVICFAFNDAITSRQV